MQAVQPNEFVLVRDQEGRHCEEFCWKHETNRLIDIMDRAEKGTLGGHIPQNGERYGCRVYFYGNRVLVKLTRRKLGCIRR
jgi:hypothetical protein